MLPPEGMFTTPEELRSSRLQGMQADYESRKSLPLLQQVAAGQGALMAEGVAGLFGLKSPEESRAAKVQKMMAGLQNSNDPKAILSVASELNKMGMTKEALFLTDRARKLQLENAAETRANAQDARAQAQSQREEAFQPYRIGQAQAGIDASKTSTARNVQAMQFAGDAEAERLKGVARDGQERALIDRVPIPRNGNFVDYYTSLANQARNEDPPRGDLVLKYTDLAEKAKKERYKIVNVPQYNQFGQFTGNRPYVIDMNGVEEGPLGDTTTAGGGGENEPPAVINLGGDGGSSSELPLPTLTPASKGVLPMLEDYSRKLKVSPDNMAELWKEYVAFSDSPYYGMTGQLNFLDWINSNPAILARYK